MIRRPLDPRFNAAVLAGRKTTTIRANPWPFGPVMLYNWTGRPYRSPQSAVAAVEVISSGMLLVVHDVAGRMRYRGGLSNAALWKSEGFDSRDDMDAWFRNVVPDDDERILWIMRFRLL